MLQLIFAMDGVCCEKSHRIYRQGDANLLPNLLLTFGFAYFASSLHSLTVCMTEDIPRFRFSTSLQVPDSELGI